MDLSSWREKIARDVAGAAWGSVSGEEEEEDDVPAILVEQQTDSAMEPAGPTQERYKDGVVTIGCVGEKVVAHAGWAGHLERREAVSSVGFQVSGGRLCEVPPRSGYRSRVSIHSPRVLGALGFQMMTVIPKSENRCEECREESIESLTKPDKGW